MTNDSMIVTSTSSYNGWGKEVSSTGSSETDRKFCTKERSTSIGLDYFGFRYYDYDLGRFTTRDPAGYPDGLNNYLYCNNDPVNKIDPLGLAKVVGVLKKSASKVRIINEKFINKAVDIAEVVNKKGKKVLKELRKRYPTVKFNKKGILDLSEYSKANVKLDRKAMKGMNPADSTLAIKKLKESGQWEKLSKKLDMDNLRWHHGPNGEMQLVPRELHEAVSHTGDAAFIRAGKKAVAITGGIVVAMFASNTSEAIENGEVSNKQIGNAIAKDVLENVDKTGATSLVKTYGEATKILAEESKSLKQAIENKNSVLNLRKHMYDD